MIVTMAKGYSLSGYGIEQPNEAERFALEELGVWHYTGMPWPPSFSLCLVKLAKYHSF